MRNFDGNAETYEQTNERTTESFTTTDQRCLSYRFDPIRSDPMWLATNEQTNEGTNERMNRSQQPIGCLSCRFDPVGSDVAGSRLRHPIRDLAPSSLSSAGAIVGPGSRR